MTQSTFQFDTGYRPPALARRSDPATSQAAAAEVAPKLGLLHQRFMEAVDDMGECTAAEAGAWCARVYGLNAETIRKRAKECERAGLVVERPARTCRISGKSATVYRRAAAGGQS